jgi:hypothetical protein
MKKGKKLKTINVEGKSAIKKIIVMNSPSASLKKKNMEHVNEKK